MIKQSRDAIILALFIVGHLCEMALADGANGIFQDSKAGESATVKDYEIEAIRCELSLAEAA
jgi:hypothetical protein